MIITFAHYKGGTGKTTSCISVAGHLAKQNKKVLVVDLDPQGNATSGLGIDKKTLDKTMYDVMEEKKQMREIILATKICNLHIAPSNQNLEKVNLRAYKRKADALILKKTLGDIQDYYDFVLIDTPPIHSHFIINGIAAADKVFVVLDPGIFALEGLETLQESFGEFFKKLGLNFNIAGVLITRTSKSFFPWRKNYSQEIKKHIENNFNKKVFMIPYSEHIYQTHVKGIPISHYKPGSKLSKAYESVSNK